MARIGQRSGSVRVSRMALPVRCSVAGRSVCMAAPIERRHRAVLRSVLPARLVGRRRSATGHGPQRRRTATRPAGRACRFSATLAAGSAPQWPCAELPSATNGRHLRRVRRTHFAALQTKPTGPASRTGDRGLPGPDMQTDAGRTLKQPCVGLVDSETPVADIMGGLVGDAETEFQRLRQTWR